MTTAQKIEAIADVLRDELYETLDDAVGAGDSYDYDAFAAKLLTLLERFANPETKR